MEKDTDFHCISSRKKVIFEFEENVKKTKKITK